ncbi:MAG: hypothetical protein AB1405_15075 [Bdellovibrionota bacterium]
MLSKARTEKRHPAMKAAMASHPSEFRVWKGTRVATLLLMYPKALSVLEKFDPSLKNLRDPSIFQLQAHRLTLGDIAWRSGHPVEDILSGLIEAGVACDPKESQK